MKSADPAGSSILNRGTSLFAICTTATRLHPMHLRRKWAVLLELSRTTSRTSRDNRRVDHDDNDRVGVRVARTIMRAMIHIGIAARIIPRMGSAKRDDENEVNAGSSCRGLRPERHPRASRASRMINLVRASDLLEIALHEIVRLLISRLSSV